MSVATIFSKEPMRYRLVLHPAILKVLVAWNWWSINQQHLLCYGTKFASFKTPWGSTVDRPRVAER
jgi:hypothetical protein